MKDSLLVVHELSSRYVDLNEYVKHSCVSVNQMSASPKKKTAEGSQGQNSYTELPSEDLEGVKKKRNKFIHSFLNQSNLHTATPKSLSTHLVKWLYSLPSEFETKEKKWLFYLTKQKIKQELRMQRVDTKNQILN